VTVFGRRGPLLDLLAIALLIGSFVIYWLFLQVRPDR
jgi:hypothetical protein